MIAALVGPSRGAVLVAPPGAGKTTRLPLRLVEEPAPCGRGEVLVVEPRRLAARLAAEHVAETLGEPVGRTVGYAVRFDTRRSAETRLTYLTGGVLLRRLREDPELTGVAAVLFDEFHERPAVVDALLAWISRLRATGGGPRLAVMSATLAGGSVASRLGLPLVESLGRQYPVEVAYVAHADGRSLALEIRGAVTEALGRPDGGDILVFLPGLRAIDGCARAVAETDARHLLFVDADVTLAPDAARRAAEVMAARKLGLLSLFGSWRLESFWERVAIPVIGWFIRGVTDVDAVNSPGRAEAFANGQFLLVERGAYEAVGGHAAVRAEVLEDVRLAQAFKRRGHALGLYAAPWAFQVRLYRTLGEIFDGYSKNFYEGMGRRPHLAVAALLFLGIASFVPYFLLPVAVAAPHLLLPGVGAPWPWQLWLGVVCGLPVAFRFRVDRADGRSGALAWTHPLGNLVLAGVLVASVLRVRTTWKGRVFNDGKAG